MPAHRTIRICLTLACLFGLLCGDAFSAEPAKIPSSLDLTKIRAIPVLYDDRWQPLDTEARDIVENVTGETFYRGQDPVAVLLAWTFDPDAWMHERLITLSNAGLRKELQLPEMQVAFSYAELTQQPHLIQLIRDLSQSRGEKPDPLQSKVSDIKEKLLLLQQVFRGQVIEPIPNPTDRLGPWQPIVSSKKPDGNLVPVVSAWTALRKAFLADDGPAFAAASDKLVAALAALPAAHRPSPSQIATELDYNRLQPFGLAWRIMLLGALLAVAALIIRQKWFDWIAILGLVAGFGMLTYGLSLRWQVAGRIPAANMFESLLFLSWGMGAFAILSMLFQRNRTVPLTASGMGALALILADCLPIDSHIRPIAPVLLDTIWMSIHVPIIMISYSVLALAVLIAHVQVATMAVVPKRRQLVETIDNLHYWYIHVGAFLLIIGIITGSMWAASSWGRYWGWDPKEVWSLVAFLGYIAILHVRLNRGKVPGWAYGVAVAMAVTLLAIVAVKLAPLTLKMLLALSGVGAAMIIFAVPRGQFATAVKSILAFWLIVMTYVGVNYVLGVGLHSYGFGTGAVAWTMLKVGAIDLAVIGACSLVYIVRAPSEFSSVTSEARCIRA
jgi:ABC-type transport system involved in cytochrome c biogenesis permease subunit